ncbi:MAG: Uma2 family endonuclease [Cyanobacteria bacterium]|jgi:Uma2 family endonuclease|nr:Uma2 family endonuclease [Cyanobacteria bacterium GSL.Bin1]
MQNSKVDQIPRLENGDRVTRPEFERRYHQMPNLKKAELIEGVVYVPSPLRYQQHGQPHSDIMGWLWVYSAATLGVYVADNTTVRLDLDNEPQPDALLRLDESLGGTSRISDDDYLEGAPELIVEIAGSSVSYDLHDKLQVYRRHGVREYLVWLVEDKAFRWYVLAEGNYQLQTMDSSGILKSPFFSGLWLDVSALLTGNRQQVLTVLQQGINSPEHQTLVEILTKGKEEG